MRSQLVTSDVWWEVARACAYATFFHTPLWHQLITMTYPGCRDITPSVVLANGTRAVLPLLEDSSPSNRLPIRFSTFAGCYGGVVADGPIEGREGETAVSHLFQTAVSWRISRFKCLSNPFAPVETLPQSLPKIRDDFTHILALEPDYETIFARFTKGHRSSIRKGQRMGVSVRLAETLEDYQAYYQTYEDSLRRWGERASSHYPWRLFENGFALAQQYPDNIRLWVAEAEGRILGGAWVFYWQRHAVWWHGAVLEDFFAYNPSNVLQDAIIRDACARGYRYYDFNPSGGYEGVIRFKRHHGAEEWPLSRYEYQPPLFRLSRALKTRFRKKVAP
ncbi:MAG: GNAT family N-acetyltransferase [Anaerolineales bacterium]|jgi:hypothetical protein|nr:GNAT family N-acetyltransferase [Anaerolineales bacterium]